MKKRILKDVRCVGLLNGNKFYNFNDANRVIGKFMQNGLLTKVTKDVTIRMYPPLTIDNRQMDESIEITKNSINEL